MKLSRSLKLARKAVQKGFTLIELAIVGLFLGLLAVFAISQFNGTATDTTKVNAYIESAQKAADNWAVITQQCGIDGNIGYSDISIAKASSGTTFDATKAANNLAYVLGFKAVGTGWDCVTSSGVRQLSGLAQGTAAAMTVMGSTLTVDSAKTTSSALGLKFASVPSTISTAVTTKLGSSNVSVTGSDMTIVRPL